MEQTEMFVQDDNRRFVYKIKNSLYGLKSMLKELIHDVSIFLHGENFFTRSENKHCVYGIYYLGV